MCGKSQAVQASILRILTTWAWRYRSVCRATYQHTSMSLYVAVLTTQAWQYRSVCQATYRPILVYTLAVTSMDLAGLGGVGQYKSGWRSMWRYILCCTKYPIYCPVPCTYICILLCTCYILLRMNTSSPPVFFGRKKSVGNFLDTQYVLVHTSIQ